MRCLLVILATLAVIALGVLLFPYTGLYNVAATSGHAGIVKWYLNTTSERSIRARAGDTLMPADLGDSSLVARGAAAFAEMCVVCHGAPGRERGVIGKGMTPTPPRLSEEAAAWSPQEVYWILEHGIKMAGMPAFGPTHTQEQLWEIVAFVKQLPDMTPAQYEALITPPSPAADSTGASSDGASSDGASGDGHDHAH